MPATLDMLRPGDTAVIVSIEGNPALVQRLYELGLLEGESVEFLTRAPLGDPIEIRVGNTRLSLRKLDAAGVRVSIPSEPEA